VLSLCPMEDMPTLTRIMTQARRVLPKATFAFNTNGDYLNVDTLSDLQEAGCNKIFVSVYGPHHGQWRDDYIRNRVIKISALCGCNIEVEAPSPPNCNASSNMVINAG
jgi:hypothetical protein